MPPRTARRNRDRRLQALAYPDGPPIGPAGPPPVTLAGYDAQKLRWRPCNHGFQCTRLLVPFDYQRPGWRRFSLPVIRLPATSPRTRIGSLVVNPGGPGGSGVQYALQARSQVSAAVRARFDVVGFDPRGVGGSIPAVSCLTDAQLDRYFATSDTPGNTAQLAPVVSESKLFARGCQEHSGALLPYVGTANAARDMDVLRAALGDAKLTYLGKSYGTYLGTWYAQLFPAHVRALVLDGAVNPGEPGFSMNLAQARGFQVALRSFIADCLRRSACPFPRGESVTAAIARVQAMLDQAARKPLQSQIAGQPGDSALLLNGVAGALYSTSFWPYLRAGLTAAFEGNGTILVALGDLLVERDSSGRYSNLVEAEMAVDCVDRPWPRSPARVAGCGGAGGPGRAPVWRGDHVGQPGVRLLAGARGSAGAATREGRTADPRRGHDPGPGNPVPLGQGAGRGPQVRGAARLERRRAHRVHAGQFVRGLRGRQVPDQPGGAAQRHRCAPNWPVRACSAGRPDASRPARPVDSCRCRPTAGGIAALAQSVRATHS